MPIDETSVEPEGSGLMPLLAAAELQDHLMTVNNDLERLQRLLDDACEALSTHFFGASGLVDQMRERLPDARDQDALQQLMLHLAGAITALQFQDMSTQLDAGSIELF